MSVWLCMPSKRPVDEANISLSEWRRQGYKIALQRDPVDKHDGIICDWLAIRDYAGYPEAANWLISELINSADMGDPSCDWFVLSGDDTTPDPNKTAGEIARECSGHFSEVIECEGGDYSGYPTFGVMQPTGDPWSDSQGRCIERIAGSPWIGREFARRINQGKGPLWLEYFHMGADEELQNVAIKYGVFWQRPDLTHMHNHWGRPAPGQKFGYMHNMPEFLKRANSSEEWANFKRVFPARKAAGFPGSEPIL